MASLEDYDEFGNYIGADLESDEDEDKRPPGPMATAATAQARDIKDHTLAHLDIYLEAYENFFREKRQGNAHGNGEERPAKDAGFIPHRWDWSVQKLWMWYPNQ